MTPRPKIYDKEVIEAASHDVAKQVYFWQNQTRKITDEKELEKIRKDILDVLDYSKDGYEMAKDLEGKFYDSDTQLVEIMEDADNSLYTYHSKRVKQWVIDNNIKPKLSIGDTVKIAPSKNKPVAEGEIFSINAQEATYSVCFPGLGHVRSGIGTHGLVLAFEYVEDQLI